MSYENIRLELTGDQVAVLTIARPQVLNALNSATVDELRSAVESLPGSGARALLITGEGRGFSSGADLASGGGLPADAGLALENHFNPLAEAIFALPIPVVAAVNGVAAGAGCSLALSADIVIAARSAYFLQAFVNIGLIPDAGATWLLPRLVGRARAMEMMMLGERLPAETALAWGLISRVVDDEAIAAEGLALATRLAKGPTVALRTIRHLARNADTIPLTQALQAERIGQKEAGETEDFKTAVFAFLQKQQPVFNGR